MGPRPERVSESVRAAKDIGIKGVKNVEQKDSIEKNTIYILYIYIHLIYLLGLATQHQVAAQLAETRM